MNDLYSIEEMEIHYDVVVGIKIKTHQLTNLKEVNLDSNYSKVIIDGEKINSLEGLNCNFSELYLNCPNLKSLEGIKYPENINCLSLELTQITDFSPLTKFKQLLVITLNNESDIEKIMPFIGKLRIGTIFLYQPKLFYPEVYRFKYKYGIKLLRSFLIKKMILAYWQRFFYPTRFSFVAFSEMISN